MTLKQHFAKALMKAGIYPSSLAREQLAAAIATDNAAAVGAIFVKTPSATAYHVPIEDGERPIPAFEAAVTQKSFKAATVMAIHIPGLLARDYSAGENFINRTILMQRIIKGADEREVAFLCGNSVDVKAKDDDGVTALHFAAGGGVPGVADALISFGADVNAADKAGRTPLMLATRGDGDAMTRLMLDNKASLQTCDGNGLNATMHAIHNQNVKAAQLLLENGGKLNLDDPAVMTLHRVATMEAEFDFIRLVNSQFDITRNRDDSLAKMTANEICNKGLDENLTVRRPLQLKR